MNYKGLKTMLNAEKTAQAILKKFNDTEGYSDRRIVFWYDKDETAADGGLEEIEPILEENNIQVHRLEQNFFETKKLIEKDKPDTHFLIYSSRGEPQPDKNWLLDIQLYSERFENSRISDIKSEFGIEGYDLDTFLEEHHKFFESKARVEPFRKLYDPKWRQDEMVLGFLTVLTGSDTIDFKDIVRKLFLKSLYENENPAWAEIQRLNLEDDFWELAGKYFGFIQSDPTLRKLFLSILLTHIKRNTALPLKKYKNYINSMSNECEIFIRTWMDHSKDGTYFDQYSRETFEDSQLKLEKYLKQEIKETEPGNYLDAEAFDVFDRAIIRQIVDSLCNDLEEYEKYLDWIFQRKSKHWYPDFQHIYSALEYAVKLHRFSKGFEKTLASCKDVRGFIARYEKDLYQMDYYYRKFYFNYDLANKKDVLAEIRERVENLYNNNLLDKMLGHWSELIDTDVDDYWKVELADRQDEFYKLYVQNTIQKNDRDKIAVIISDAMRYEIAVELQETLNKARLGTMELKTMVGSLPSYTRLGMASLLPHDSLQLKNDHYLADGISTEGTPNRAKIVDKATPDSVTLTDKELIDLSREELREKYKGKRLFYIYHDVIDSTGEHSEDKVFKETDTCIQEIQKIIGKLTNSRILNNVIITADHGFIYRRDDLESVYKLDKATFDKDRIIDSKKRFILTTENIDVMNTHKFKINNLVEAENDLYAYVPKTDLRFRMQGGGNKFVHGGLAPQEIIIPVLKYSHKVNAELASKGIKMGKVGVTVTNPGRRITSNSFSVNLLQTEKVSDKLKPVKLRIALWDSEFDGEKVSDEKTVIMESSSGEPEERQQKVILTLGKNVENKTYYLKLIDEDLNATKKHIIDPIPFEVDLLLKDDFDF